VDDIGVKKIVALCEKREAKEEFELKREKFTVGPLDSKKCAVPIFPSVWIHP
jgi:hypothetical protein